MFLRRIAFFMGFILFSLTLTGCFDKREIDDLTYVVAMGLDKGKANTLRLTIQYTIPLKVASGGGGEQDSKTSDSGKEETPGIVTVDAPTIYSGLDMINNFVGKQLSMSQVKVTVFSQEIVKEGKMHDYLNAIMRGREFRPNMYIAVARDSAEDYIKAVKPIQEADPSKYYELKFSAYNYNGFTTNSTINRIYNQMEATTGSAVATLVGVGKYESTKDIPSGVNSAVNKKENPRMGQYYAGDIPKAGDVKAETLGLVALSGDKFAGFLDGEETIQYLMATGNYKNSYYTFPDPEVKDSYVVLNLKQKRDPQISVNIKTDKPIINLTVSLEGDFLSIQSGVNYEEGKKLNEFQNFAENYFKKEMTAFLKKITEKYKSDICAFGRYAKGQFLIWDDWKKYQWLKKYQNSKFNIQISLSVRRTGLIIKSVK